MFVFIAYREIVLRFIILGLLLLSHSMFSYANMASPTIDGTNASTAYSSKDIDILSETININIKKVFMKLIMILLTRFIAIKKENEYR